MKPTKNSFQIIAGKYRGKKLHFPDVAGLRPTPNKVRETLFNWIQFETADKTFLDLFAGSGALSFEAISRGAKYVSSVEENKIAFQNLKNNQQLLKSEKIHIFHQDALDFLSTTPNFYFDFILLDPPFGQNLIPKTLKLLAKKKFINAKSKLYIESEYPISENAAAADLSMPVKISKQKLAGQVHYCLLRFEESINTLQNT